MKRELIVIRPGKAEAANGYGDRQRSLKDKSKRHAQRLGVWLQQQALIPDQVFSSPAERALVTAQKACKAMDRTSKQIVADERLYRADLQATLAVLRECPSHRERVLLVAHGAMLESLLMHLTCDRIRRKSLQLPAATLARLEFTGAWSELAAGCADLLALVQGASLPKKFPFPTPAGTELRDRPAYYYTQSGVIPYRVLNGETEVMIIRSSKGKHWVIPKGIKEPGYSPAASAAKEAWEEAGIEGRVESKRLGCYSYQKWGSHCHVEIFPMEVTRVIPESVWEESHRQRRWLSPAHAAARVKYEALRPMIHSLAGRFDR